MRSFPLIFAPRANCDRLLLQFPVYLLAALLLIWPAGCLAAGNVAELDRENGLSNAQLGAPVSSFQGLQKTEDLGRFQSYRRPGDNLRYGKFAVDSITYNFFKDRLYSVVLTIANRGNVKGVVKLLEEKYGRDYTLDTLPVAKSILTMEVREWDGQKAYCVMKNGSDNEGGELRFIDKATWDLLEAPRREQREANKAKLQGSILDGGLTLKPEASPTASPTSSPAQPLPPAPQ